MRVCLGGTFYPLHRGHKELLRKAFQVAGSNGSVYIGVTSTRMAKKKGVAVSYEERKHLIEQFLSKEQVLKQAEIHPLSNKFGPTLKKDFDAIIVSPETKSVADEINKKRIQDWKKPMQIVLISFILSEDGKPISSSRIRQKEIDENGNIVQEE